MWRETESEFLVGELWLFLSKKIIPLTQLLISLSMLSLL